MADIHFAQEVREAVKELKREQEVVAIGESTEVVIELREILESIGLVAVISELVAVIHAAITLDKLIKNVADAIVEVVVILNYSVDSFQLAVRLT